MPGVFQGTVLGATLLSDTRVVRVTVACCVTCDRVSATTCPTGAAETLAAQRRHSRRAHRYGRRSRRAETVDRGPPPAGAGWPSEEVLWAERGERDGE